MLSTWTYCLNAPSKNIKMVLIKTLKLMLNLKALIVNMTLKISVRFNIVVGRVSRPLHIGRSRRRTRRASLTKELTQSGPIVGTGLVIDGVGRSHPQTRVAGIGQIIAVVRMVFGLRAIYPVKIIVTRRRVARDLVRVGDADPHVAGAVGRLIADGRVVVDFLLQDGQMTAVGFAIGLRLGPVFRVALVLVPVAVVERVAGRRDRGRRRALFCNILKLMAHE